MTEQMDPEFLAFSEMLDNEESLSESALSLYGEDSEVLLALRQHLRQEDGAAALPSDFARSTATSIEKRFQNQPALTRTLLKWEPWLRARAASKAGLKVTLAASAFGLCVAAGLSWKGLGLAGILALVAAGGLKLLYGQKLPGTFELSPLREGRSTTLWSGMFYLIPAIAMVVASGLVGKAVSSVGELSLSFKSQGTDFQKVGLAAAAVILGMLVSSLGPLLVALERRTRRRPFATLALQSIFALFLYVAAADASQNSPTWWRLDLGLWVLLALMAALALGVASRPGEAVKSSLRGPLGSLFRGLLSGGVAVLLVLVFFYQVHLTRDLHVQTQVDNMHQEVEDWLAAHESIPDQQNGFVELEEYLYAGARPSGKDEPAQVAPDVQRVCDALKKGSVIYDYKLFPEENKKNRKEEDLDEARRAFLSELPRIRSASAKPFFVYHRGGDYNILGKVPNFILARAISQGLEGLVLESLERKDYAEALDKMLLNLRWSSRLREGNLINLMIAVAQTSIARSSVEELVLEGNLTSSQLRRLLDALTDSSSPRELYRETMMRECYLTEKAFRERTIPSSYTNMGEKPPAVLSLVPDSYWESERKAYLNYQLAQEMNWLDLSRPIHDESVRVAMPWSLAIQKIVPNLSRASAQFMLNHSRGNALRLVTALEIFEREHGRYPDKLEQLVPEILDHLPVDAMNPNLWKHKPGFTYRKSGDGYVLLSESSVYANITMASRQSYGPDGDYEMARSPR